MIPEYQIDGSDHLRMRFSKTPFVTEFSKLKHDIILKDVFKINVDVDGIYRNLKIYALRGSNTR